MTEIQLPEGWVWKKLGEVCTQVQKTGLKFQNPEGQIKYVDIDSIDNQKYRIENPKLYIWRNAPSRAQQVLKSGDVVFSTVRTYLKNIAMVPQDLDGQIASTGFCVLRPGLNLSSLYLYYYVLTKQFLNPLSEIQRGTSYPAVRNSDVFDQNIPLPPLSVQRAIVARIEELFSDLEAGTRELQTALARLKTYRQAVLSKFFAEATRQHPTTTIGEIANVGTGVTPLKSNKLFYQGGTIPWVTSGALNSLYVLKSDGLVTGHALEKTNLKLYPKHTLLVALYGEGKTRGKCSELLIEATTNQAIAAIVIKPEYEGIRPYLKWFLVKNYEDIRKLSSGGVQPNLNLSIIKNTEFPLPDLATQTQIVSEIESRLSEADAMETTIRQELARAESLRQSILKRAFAGQLVPEPIEQLAAENVAVVSEPGSPVYGGQGDQLTLF